MGVNTVYKLDINSMDTRPTGCKLICCGVDTDKFLYDRRNC